VIADLSVNYVERLVLLAGNTLERIPSDYGLDVQMWTFDERGELRENFVLFQVKATDDLRLIDADQVVAIRVERRDYRFWSALAMPVVLVVYDVVNDRAYWVHVQGHAQAQVTGTIIEFSATLTIRIPVSQMVSVDAIHDLTRLREITP